MRKLLSIGTRDDDSGYSMAPNARKIWGSMHAEAPSGLNWIDNSELIIHGPPSSDRP